MPESIIESYLQNYKLISSVIMKKYTQSPRVRPFFERAFGGTTCRRDKNGNLKQVEKLLFILMQFRFIIEKKTGKKIRKTANKNGVKDSAVKSRYTPRQEVFSIVIRFPTCKQTLQQKNLFWYFYFFPSVLSNLCLGYFLSCTYFNYYYRSFSLSSLQSAFYNFQIAKGK